MSSDTLYCYHPLLDSLTSEDYVVPAIYKRDALVNRVVEKRETLLAFKHKREAKQYVYRPSIFKGHQLVTRNIHPKTLPVPQYWMPLLIVGLLLLLVIIKVKVCLQCVI